MTIRNVAQLALAVLVCAAAARAQDILPPANGILEDFADTSDAWVGTTGPSTIRVNPTGDTDWALVTGSQHARWSAGDTGREWITSDEFYTATTAGSKDPNRPFMDVSAFTAFQFDLTNPNQNSISFTGDQGFAINFDRHSNSETVINLAEWNYDSLLAAAAHSTTLAPGETVTLQAVFDDYDRLDRSALTDLVGWDATNNVRRISAWGFEADGSAITNDDFIISNLSLFPLPITQNAPEPASVVLWLLLGVIGAGYFWRARRRG